MEEHNQVSRRSSLKSMSVLGAAALLGSQSASGAAATAPAVGEGVATSDVRKQIADKVWKTSFVDTHEHLVEEKVRLAPETMPFIQCHDWSLLVAGYLHSDLIVAGLQCRRIHDWSEHDFFSPTDRPHQEVVSHSSVLASREEHGIRIGFSLVAQRTLRR